MIAILFLVSSDIIYFCYFKRTCISKKLSCLLNEVQVVDDECSLNFAGFVVALKTGFKLKIWKFFILRITLEATIHNFLNRKDAFILCWR